jgi:hypothetical protein
VIPALAQRNGVVIEGSGPRIAVRKPFGVALLFADVADVVVPSKDIGPLAL